MNHSQQPQQRCQHIKIQKHQRFFEPGNTFTFESTSRSPSRSPSTSPELQLNSPSSSLSKFVSSTTSTNSSTALSSIRSSNPKRIRKSSAPPTPPPPPISYSSNMALKTITVGRKKSQRQQAITIHNKKHRRNISNKNSNNNNSNNNKNSINHSIDDATEAELKKAKSVQSARDCRRRKKAFIQTLQLAVKQCEEREIKSQHILANLEQQIKTISEQKGIPYSKTITQVAMNPNTPNAVGTNVIDFDLNLEFEQSPSPSDSNSSPELSSPFLYNQYENTTQQHNLTSPNTLNLDLIYRTANA